MSPTATRFTGPPPPSNFRKIRLIQPGIVANTAAPVSYRYVIEGFGVLALTQAKLANE